jgi:hypothetical protein
MIERCMPGVFRGAGAIQLDVFEAGPVAEVEGAAVRVSHQLRPLDVLDGRPEPASLDSGLDGVDAPIPVDEVAGLPGSVGSDDQVIAAGRILGEAAPSAEHVLSDGQVVDSRGVIPYGRRP